MAGHIQVTDRDSFLRGAMNAADYNRETREERKTITPRVEKSNLVRPGTKTYAGASKMSATSQTKTTKKKTRTKKTSATKPPEAEQASTLVGKTADTIVLDDPDAPAGTSNDAPEPTITLEEASLEAYEDPANPSLDDIERAKSILAQAKAVGNPFADHVNDPPPEDPPTHTSVAGEFAIDDIDEVMSPPQEKALPALSLVKEIVPPELVEHLCGLPEILREKEQIVKYLIAHSITHKIRKALDYTSEEKDLYEAHTRDQKHKRASLGHFTAALRLWRNGYPINPKAAVDLNAMKGV